MSVFIEYFAFDRPPVCLWKSLKVSANLTASRGWWALWWAHLEGEGTPAERYAAALRRHQRRFFDAGTTVNPSWRAASARRSSNATKGSGWLISRWR